MDWGTFGHIALQVAPGVLALIPGMPLILIPVITHAIITAEQSGKPGADKKAIVLNEVHDALEVNNAVKPNHAIATDTVVDAVGKGIDATVTTVNAVQKAIAGTPPPSAPPTA